MHPLSHLFGASSISNKMKPKMKHIVNNMVLPRGSAPQVLRLFFFFECGQHNFLFFFFGVSNSFHVNGERGGERNSGTILGSKISSYTTGLTAIICHCGLDWCTPSVYCRPPGYRYFGSHSNIRMSPTISFLA